MRKRVQDRTPEQRRTWHAGWRARHAAEWSAYQAQWRAANPQKVYVSQLLNNARRRAGARGVPCTVTFADVEGMVATSSTCPGCGAEMVRAAGRVCPQSFTLDRLIPGLGYVPGNVVGMCHACNTLKRGLTPGQMLHLGQMAERLLALQPEGLA